MLKKITKVEALMLGKKHKINFDVIDFSEWHAGLNIELEHQNLTKGSLEKTTTIVLAHLREYPNYYKYLIKMEKALEKYWSTREMKSIFL